MAQLQQSVDIARLLEEVFAFVANPANDARWGSNLLEVTRVSPGPLEVGARFRYRARFAGRQFGLVREATEDEPNRRQAVKTISGPRRWGGGRTFEAIPGGTQRTRGPSAVRSARRSRWCSATWRGLRRWASAWTRSRCSGCWAGTTSGCARSSSATRERWRSS
jgi:Polyketide cyclase / dehydrase and lipid transport